MIYYAKLKGSDDFFKVSAHFQISNKGYRLLYVDKIDQISKYQFYKQPREIRFNVNRLVDPEKGYFHEVGNTNFFAKLKAIEEAIN